MTSMKNELTIRSADPERDYEQIVDLTGKTFMGYWEWRERCRDGYIKSGPYDWTATRLAFAGDQLVAHFGVWDVTLRFGEGRLRVAGIGAVACHPDFRRRGIVKRLAEDAIDGLAPLGYHASLLYGITDFYHRFGYVTIWPEIEWRVHTKELLLPPQPTEHRVFSASAPSKQHNDKSVPLPALEEISDWEEVAPCANYWHADLPGTAMRPTYRRNPRSRLGFGRLWRDESGKVTGYVVCGAGDGTLYVSDLAGDPEMVLAVLTVLAKEQMCEQIVLRNMPPASPYVKALRRRPFRLTEDHRPNGGPMGRVVSLYRTLQAMEGELTRRYQRVTAFLTPPDGNRGAPIREVLFTLNDGREECVIIAENNGIRAFPIDAVDFTSSDKSVPRIDAGDSAIRLVFGTHSVDDLSESGEITVADQKTRVIASLLFPEIAPPLPAWDRM